MRIHRIPACSLAVSALAAASALTALAADPPPQNRLAVGYRLGFRIEADFQQLPQPAARNNPSVSGRSYADGFVGLDATGNAGGLSSFWGYDRDAQFAGDSLLLTGTEGGSVTGDRDGDPQHGVELVYSRLLGHSDNIRWGVEGAFGFSDLTIRGSGSRMQVDAFPLGGVLPPGAPYTGPFTPAPGTSVIGATPTPLSVKVVNQFEASMYSLRLGPYLEVPLADRIGLGFSGGLALGVFDGEFSYTQSLTPPGAAPIRSSRSDSDTEFVVGGYLAGQMSVELSRSVELYAGIQWQPMDGFTQRAGDKSVKVKLSDTIFVAVGFGYRF